MTILMEGAVQRLRSVPEDRQDAVARLVLMLAETEDGDEPTVEDVSAIA